MKNDDKIKISVILTTRNRKYEIARALRCVLEQTIHPYEIILVDDASEDGTKEYLAESLDLTSVIYIRNDERKGAGASRNIGIAAARGDYIAFLDSDNEWEKNKLEVFSSYLYGKEDVDFLCSRYEKRIEFKLLILPDGIVRSKMCGNEEIFMFNPADASATIYKKRFLGSLGGFSEKMSINIDWEILLRATATKEVRFFVIPEVLSRHWTMYDGIMSRSDVYIQEWIKLLGEYREEILDHNLGYEAFSQFIIQNHYLLTEQEAEQIFFESFGGDTRWQRCICDHLRMQLKESQKLVSNKNSFYEFVRTWLEAKIYKKDVSDILLSEGIKNIAIYGFGIHGKLLYSDLMQSDKIRILYVIDKKNYNVTNMLDVPIYGLEDTLPQVDAIVITPYLQFGQIESELKTICDYKLVSINDIVRQLRE